MDDIKIKIELTLIELHDLIYSLERVNTDAFDLPDLEELMEKLQKSYDVSVKSFDAPTSTCEGNANSNLRDFQRNLIEEIELE